MKALRLAALLALGFCGASQAQNAKPVRITVDEGTSMSVAVSPDGKIAGHGPAGQHLGAAGRRRRGARASPICSMMRASRSGRRTARPSPSSPIATAAMTSGRFRRTAPASGRSPGARSTTASRPSAMTAPASLFPPTAAIRWAATTTSSCWICAAARSASSPMIRRKTCMPSWSPDDRQIAFASTRENGHGVWAVDAAGGPEQRAGAKCFAHRCRRLGPGRRDRCSGHRWRVERSPWLAGGERQVHHRR